MSQTSISLIWRAFNHFAIVAWIVELICSQQTLEPAVKGHGASTGAATAKGRGAGETTHGLPGAPPASCRPSMCRWPYGEPSAKRSFPTTEVGTVHWLPEPPEQP